MKAYWKRKGIALVRGNSFRLLKELPEDSISAVVTDPPYELGFMGKKWDSSGITYDVRFWQRVYRVMKPGAYLLAFGGTRTSHRIAVAIEDAGFEIRDSIIWMYGQGFPKSLDISKAIDKEAGAKRKVVGTKLGLPGYSLNPNRGAGIAMEDNVDGSLRKPELECSITEPATKDAQKWNGWGTALKPAHEPIIVARKPLSEKTVAKNVLKHGTGGMNIDGTRVGTVELPAHIRGKALIGTFKGTEGLVTAKPFGRWPANVILSSKSARDLDKMSGVLKTNSGKALGSKVGAQAIYGNIIGKTYDNKPGDSGGASRFFYIAKASRRERGEGNKHSTVKPLTLMRYLVKLVTPPDGLILDPFAGSGTTLLAAQKEGFKCIGMELKLAHCEIAASRLEQ